jgi:hypothetical protein
MFVALVTALAMSLAVASPANAVTSGLCWVNSSHTARLSVSKWIIGYDSVGHPKYRYHMDINAGGLHVTGLYFRGIKQAGWNDRYADTWSSPSTISGIWDTNALEDSQVYKCSVVV